jgi:hypothetical protein
VIEYSAARYAEGKAEGKIEALLNIFTVRGIAVSEHARARIRACKDVGTLDRWIAGAITAASAQDVLDPPA